MTVISHAGTSKDKATLWLCKCDCGNEKIVRGKHLKNGFIQSCGCLRNELARERLTSHKKTGSKIYEKWTGMIQRCTNPKGDHYHRYGGRGIKVHPAWMDFETFYRDVGDFPKGMTLDRINNNGNYEPGNVRWATQKQQNNNKENNIKTLFRENICTVAEIAVILCQSPSVVSERLRNGRDIEKPIKKTAPQNKDLCEKSRLFSKKLCAKYGTVRMRIRRGIDLEKPFRKPPTKSVLFRGELMTAHEIAKKLGVKYGAVARRIFDGVDLEKPFRKSPASYVRQVKESTGFGSIQPAE
jgi:hypothetical protein